VGRAFRSITTGAGYRPRLVELGVDKDLDDLALGRRPSSSSDLLLGLENRIQQDLASDCGARWAYLLRGHWGRTREVLQQLAREVETTPMDLEHGASAVRSGFTAPMLAWVVRFAVHQFPGIDVEVWWLSPMAAWIKLVAGVANVDESEVLDRLYETPRTTERWKAGDPVGELRFPYRDSVRRCLREDICRCSVEQVDLLAGWLTLAVSYQSISADLRDEVRRSFAINPQQPWSPAAFIADLQRKSHDLGPRDLWAKAEPIAVQIARGLSAEQLNSDHVEALLGDYKLLIDSEFKHSGMSYQYIHDCLRARLGADPNRRYKVAHEHMAEWTPTLFGAQLGDLDVFRALLQHGGDPDLTLMVSSSLDRQDAMWVAASHGRHAIVDILRAYASPSWCCSLTKKKK